jgi:hypothetical protein
VSAQPPTSTPSAGMVWFCSTCGRRLHGGTVMTSPKRPPIAAHPSCPIPWYTNMEQRPGHALWFVPVYFIPRGTPRGMAISAPCTGWGRTPAWAPHAGCPVLTFHGSAYHVPHVASCQEAGNPQAEGCQAPGIAHMGMATLLKYTASPCCPPQCAACPLTPAHAVRVAVAWHHAAAYI